MADLDDAAVVQFLAIFPEGFNDPAHVGEGTGRRASRWRAAHDEWSVAFGKGEGERLVAADDLVSLVKRFLLVEERMAPLHPIADADAVKDALSRDEATRPFCAALVELLSEPSPGRARFEKLFAAARELPIAPAQQWLVATLFPFVASPGREVLLRPRIACEAAARLGFDLRYDASPSWETYDALRALSTQLLEKLRPSGAKDFVDVEAFLHVTATARHAPIEPPR